jgi:hypothetical protein
VDLFKGPKVSLTPLDSVRTFRVKLAAYRTTLETHWQWAAEFAPNSYLYREIIFSKFTQTDLIHFQEQKATKMWPTSPDGLLAWLDLRQSALEATDIGVRAKTTTQPTVIESLNTAFSVTENPQEIEYDDVLQEAAIDKQMHFIVDEDTPPHIVEQVLNIRHNTGRADYVKIVACEWKGKECTTSHLLRDCPVFKKKVPNDRMKHLQVLDRCFNCMKKGHRSRQCTSIVRCIKCKARHNIALHDAWLEKNRQLPC